MDCNGWEVAFTQELVQFGGSECTLDKDDDLVELKLIEQFVKLSVLLLLIELDIVLLETVESKFSLIIDIDFKRVLHELLANWSDLLRQSGTEHHDLLLRWGSTEDLLNVTAHVCIQVSNVKYQRIRKFVPPI
jgi:hypothetical protein